LISENDRKPGSACNALLYGSLFSGYGGIDRGLDAAGMTCNYQVEISPDAREVLAAYWPRVPKHDDIRTFEPRPTDIIAGGFPCQDISSANQNKTGIEGDRSGLWSEYLRVIDAVRPRVVIIENVSSIVVRGLSQVVSDLAGIGFAAGWRVFCSSEFGFPFMRRRMFMVACPNGNRKPAMCIHAKVEGMPRVAKDRWERQLREVAGSPRVTDGLSGRIQRCSGIGNAVIPAMAEWVGRRVTESI
jgi:DNA (cytosine-5)-methyltransferase 1